VIKVLVVIFALLLAGCTIPAQPAHTEFTPTATVTIIPTSKIVHAAVRVVSTPTPVRCVVSTGYDDGLVNVRSGPGMSYPVVDVVQEGQELPVLSDPVDGWVKVCTSKLVEGWFYQERWCKR
jgi:uncharacterized protein YgiM (DUF1202 family)